MERLTLKDFDMCHYCSYGKTCEHYVDNSFPVCEERAIYGRLAAYEDTGMEPDEIAKIREDIEDGYMKSTARRYGISLDRLRELAQADREGRCVVLPIGGYSDKDGEKALKNAMFVCSLTNNAVNRYTADAIAEKLTRAEAEAALRREQDG